MSLFTHISLHPWAVYRSNVNSIAKNIGMNDYFQKNARSS